MSLFLAVVLIAGCGITGISRDGPTPELSQVERVDEGFPEESVFCTDLGGQIRIDGTGISPMPIDLLTDDPGLALPEVLLVAEDGSISPIAVTQFDPTDGSLYATVPAGLDLGVYDLTVVNPNENQGSLPDAVLIVPPPVITMVEPSSGTNDQTTPVTITGENFREAGDGTQPTASLSMDGGVPYDLEGVGFVSETQIDGVVPAGLPVGVYDLTVTNPEGCSDTLEDAFEVLEPALIDICSFVDPAFGWVHARTTIQICADNSEGNGLLSTPEVFMVIEDQEVPLIREAYLSPELMSAVVPSQEDNPSIVVGGPYTIRVRNPDGASGTIENAFTVLPDPPPDILWVNPARGDKSTLVTITVVGRDFKDGTLGDGSPILTIALIDPDGNEFPCGDSSVVLDSPEAGQDTASCEITLPGETGGYVLRVRHEDDGSFDLFSAFAVTEASRKLDNVTTAAQSLNAARRSHGIALGQDDLGNRFVWVVGGENADGALDSVEAASLSNFGVLSQWTLLSSTLPEARGGLSLVRAGRYLYSIGGSSDGVDPLATGSVLRAKILGTDTAPVIGFPEAAAGGQLAGGTYYYRISAIMADSTDNPLGETLPSDEESIRVADGGQVTLTWTVADSALVDHFRIYRSPDPNMISGDEVLLADDVAPGDTSFVDDGSLTPDPSARPLPPGSLGVWVAMDELGQSRYDAEATLVRTDPDHAYLYVVGGRNGPGDPADLGVNGTLATTEWAALSGDGRDILNGWQAGPDLGQARAQHALLTVSHDQASLIPQGNFYLAVAAGTGGDRAEDGLGFRDIESLAIDTTGTPGEPLAWVQQSGQDLKNTRIGFSAILVNDFFYAFNGWAGSGGAYKRDGEKSDTPTEEACAGGDCQPSFGNFSSTTIDFVSQGVSYESGTVFFGAFFYFVGGSFELDVSTTSADVVWGTY